MLSKYIPLRFSSLLNCASSNKNNPILKSLAYLNISLQRSGVTIKTFLLACAIFTFSINVRILTLLSGIRLQSFE